MTRSTLFLTVPFALLFGCSGSDSTPPPVESGGSPGSTGGQSSASGSTAAVTGGASNPGSATGGIVTTGGASAVAASGGAGTGGLPATGGKVATGGLAATGGSRATGGATSAVTGGTPATGGAKTGGSPSTGGTIATGGSVATGGSKATTGGTAATGGAKTGGATSTGGAKTGGATSTGGTTGTAGSGACAAPVVGSKGTNPLFTDQYTADPAVMVDNCTFYIQCGHDEGSTGFVMKEWFLLKSTDMVHWTKTVTMTLSTFKWANANAWAGQMIKALNGKYYWYVPIQQASDNTMSIGVAVANAPEGPWTDALGKALINDAFEMSNMGYANAGATSYTIDPTIFIDDDGQAYLQYGGFWRMTTAKLNADMITVNGKMVESTPPNYFESPFLVKRNGKYYQFYSAGSANPTTIDWATATSPMGPWTRGGTILSAFTAASGQDAPTNHAGVGVLAGQWYIAYHVSNGPNGGGTYKREVAVDKLTWSGDTPQKVTPSAGMSF